MAVARRAILLSTAVVAIALVGFGCWLVLPLIQHRDEATPSVQPASQTPVRIELDGSSNDALSLPAEVCERLKLEYFSVKEAASQDPLQLNGSLFLDADHLAHVRSRFDGEVVKPDDKTLGEGNGELRVGDRIKQGQLLAVIWSNELGERKSELVDALSRLHLTNVTYEKLKELSGQGVVPDRSLREAERAVEGNLIDVAKLERTLESWRVTKEELAEIRRDVAEKGYSASSEVKYDVSKWARVEVRAPIDGVLVEKNVTPGDYVTPSFDMFQIADMSHLDVLAYAYEDEVDVLSHLASTNRAWKIRLLGRRDSPIREGEFDRIGDIIDPVQRTAVVIGKAFNREGDLRVGEYVVVEIDRPALPNSVSIPSKAVIEQANRAFVFVVDQQRSSSTRKVIALRRVSIVDRVGDSVSVSSIAGQTAESGSTDAVKAGDVILVSGTLELMSELESLKQASSSSQNETHPPQESK